MLQEDIDQYDFKCKVEPLQRALKEADTNAWINGRRRDHGAERATLPVWESDKVCGLAPIGQDAPFGLAADSPCVYCERMSGDLDLFFAVYAYR